MTEGVELRLKKKLLIAMLAVACVTILIGCGESRESRASNTMNLIDIADNWTYPYLESLIKQGIIVGYGDGTFHPEQSITRAEFITMINRAFDITARTRVPYMDVWFWDWYYEDVSHAVAAGFIPSNFGSKLEPNRQLTREEAATMIAMALNLDVSQYETLPFIDGANVSEDYRQPLIAIVKAGYMTGYPDGTFRPLVPLSRAEAAVLISKVLDLDIPYTGGGHSVKDFGAKGDGITDDTAAIQKTVDYVFSRGGGTVSIPGGVYLIDSDISVVLRSNIKLNLADNAILEAKPTSSGNNALVKINNVSNVTLAGGNIIGDRYSHLGTNGEWGMGIKILGSNSISITDVSISECWGDAIYVSGSSVQQFSEKVLIDRVTCESNRRQGLSIISVKGITVRDSGFINTKGIGPQSGINIEPNDFLTEFAQNILIDNVHTENNQGWGIAITWGYFQKTSNPSDITIKNCTDKGSKKGAIRPWEHLLSPICKIEVI